MPSTTGLLGAHCLPPTPNRPTEPGRFPERPMAQQRDSLWGFLGKTVPSSVHLLGPRKPGQALRSLRGTAGGPQAGPGPPLHLQRRGGAGGSRSRWGVGAGALGNRPPEPCPLLSQAGEEVAGRPRDPWPPPPLRGALFLLPSPAPPLCLTHLGWPPGRGKEGSGDEACIQPRREGARAGRGEPGREQPH